MPVFGEIHTVSGGPYTSKPRPVLIFQDTSIYTGKSIIAIPFTSQKNPDITTRIAVKPSKENGLDRPCFLEVDKLSALNTKYLGEQIGALESSHLDATKQAVRKLLKL
ncbi:MAG: type II toxin-antitoxin system PemK/MazF family toxin [Actinomycetes bacterium]|nr:type II toxin-antitoxin system PemK/MazF family toxin [Actinomycetes bacterium]